MGYKLKSNNYTVRGVGPYHQFNELTVIMNGRYINEADIFNKERNVVIGRLVKQDLLLLAFFLYLISKSHHQSLQLPYS